MTYWTGDYARPIPPRSWPTTDAYGADEPSCCPKCDAYMEAEGDRWEGTERCPECGFERYWDNLPSCREDAYGW